MRRCRDQRGRVRAWAVWLSAGGWLGSAPIPEVTGLKQRRARPIFGHDEMLASILVCRLASADVRLHRTTEVHIGDTNGQAKPRLVVGITVDQMRADYLTRFGLGKTPHLRRRLVKVDSAAWLKRVLHVATTTLDYAPTYTGPGHASRSTQEQHPWCTAFWPTIGTTAQPLQACTAPRTPRSKGCTMKA